MKRLLWLASAALVLASHGWVLVSTLWNRGAAPGGTVELTERELRLVPAPNESTAVLLELRWDVGANEPDDDDAPAWLNASKLQELGFDCRVPVDSPHARDHYRAVPPAWLYVVLEFDGDAAKKPGRHRSGIVLDGRAFVLVGPEGSGKTTFCRAASEAGAVVLSDDVTLVDASGAAVEALGAPFRHRPFPPPPKGRWPVAAILLPRHGCAPSLDPVARLFLEARLAENLLYVRKSIGSDPRVETIADSLIVRVPARVLTLAPDRSFVEELRRFR